MLWTLGKQQWTKQTAMLPSESFHFRRKSGNSIVITGGREGLILWLATSLGSDMWTFYWVYALGLYPPSNPLSSVQLSSIQLLEALLRCIFLLEYHVMEGFMTILQRVVRPRSQALSLWRQS